MVRHLVRSRPFVLIARTHLYMFRFHFHVQQKRSIVIARIRNPNSFNLSANRWRRSLNNQIKWYWIENDSLPTQRRVTIHTQRKFLYSVKLALPTHSDSKIIAISDHANIHSFYSFGFPHLVFYFARIAVHEYRTDANVNTNGTKVDVKESVKCKHSVNHSLHKTKRTIWIVHI